MNLEEILKIINTPKDILIKNLACCDQLERDILKILLIRRCALSVWEIRDMLTYLYSPEHPIPSFRTIESRLEELVNLRLVIRRELSKSRKKAVYAVNPTLYEILEEIALLEEVDYEER